MGGTVMERFGCHWLCQCCSACWHRHIDCKVDRMDGLNFKPTSNGLVSTGRAQSDPTGATPRAYTKGVRAMRSWFRAFVDYYVNHDLFIRFMLIFLLIVSHTVTPRVWTYGVVYPTYEWLFRLLSAWAIVILPDSLVVTIGIAGSRRLHIIVGLFVATLAILTISRQINTGMSLRPYSADHSGVESAKERTTMQRSNEQLWNGTALDESQGIIIPVLPGTSASNRPTPGLSGSGGTADGAPESKVK